MQNVSCRSLLKRYLLIFGFCLCIACGDSGGYGTISVVVGPAGGEVTSGDGVLTLTFPAGALSTETTISVTRLSPFVLPSALNAILEINSVYKLEPEGLTFAVPVTVSIIVQGSIEDLPARFLLSRSGDIYSIPKSQLLDHDEDLAMTMLSGKINHFSEVWDNLPRDGGIRVRYSGIPTSAPVGDNVFTATATVSQQATSKIRADGVVFSDDESVFTIQAHDYQAGFNDATTNIGRLDANRAQQLSGSLKYDCEAVGVGEYRGVVEFGLYDIEALFFTLGTFVSFEGGSASATILGFDYTSRARRTITCGIGIESESSSSSSTSTSTSSSSSSSTSTSSSSSTSTSSSAQTATSSSSSSTSSSAQVSFSGEGGYTPGAGNCGFNQQINISNTGNMMANVSGLPGNGTLVGMVESSSKISLHNVVVFGVSNHDCTIVRSGGTLTINCSRPGASCQQVAS